MPAVEPGLEVEGSECLAEWEWDVELKFEFAGPSGLFEPSELLRFLVTLGCVR